MNRAKRRRPNSNEFTGPQRQRQRHAYCSDSSLTVASWSNLASASAAAAAHTGLFFFGFRRRDGDGSVAFVCGCLFPLFLLLPTREAGSGEREVAENGEEWSRRAWVGGSRPGTSSRAPSAQRAGAGADADRTPSGAVRTIVSGRSCRIRSSYLGIEIWKKTNEYGAGHLVTATKI